MKCAPAREAKPSCQSLASRSHQVSCPHRSCGWWLECLELLVSVSTRYHGSWHSHSHAHLHLHAETGSDTCQCQTRDCNNPPPQHGGATCSGAKVRVTNCTVHGDWTAWSSWSACSQTCGFAMKTRRRTCTNPAPAFGGRVCVGHDHDDTVCINLPPCPTPAKVAPPPPQTFGQWSSWSAWNACSRPCNGGIRIRRRTCESPSSRKPPTVECNGCDFQVEECNSHQCVETKRYSGWTPWLAVNGSLQSTNIG